MNFKFTQTTTAVLTVSLPGAIKTPEYKSARELYPCSRRTIISNKTLNFWASPEGLPKNCRKNWSQLNKIQRIFANANYLADGNQFTLEFID